jgi:hypothetical protein
MPSSRLSIYAAPGRHMASRPGGREALESSLLGMHNNCGKAVQELRTKFVQAAWLCARTVGTGRAVVYKLSGFARVCTRLVHALPHSQKADLPLFSGYFYPLSTRLITTTTKYINN